MAKPIFQVKKTGLFTTYQDLGRWGYQQFGVPVSGAMDPFALQVGNLLVGNNANEAAIEMTMIGPELLVLSDHIVAITGADLDAKLNGNSVPLWQAVKIREGDTLTFTSPRKGVRAYLAVAGGVNIPMIMGSKSTYVKARIGTLIQKGDVIDGFSIEHSHTSVGLSYQSRPKHNQVVTVRIILGPHDHQFTDKGIRTFFESEYVVKQADRMGYRLEGDTPLEHKGGADIISDTVPFGGIQVPLNGQPIILMADRQTTGGYARIGTIITADIPKVSQLPPGGKIRFQPITVEEAETLLKQEQRLLSCLKVGVRNRQVPDRAR